MMLTTKAGVFRAKNNCLYLRNGSSIMATSVSSRIDAGTSNEQIPTMVTAQASPSDLLGRLNLRAAYFTTPFLEVSICINQN
jgi:hypothetical protein